MGYMAAIGGVLGAGTSLLNWFTADKSSPKYDYKKAYKALDQYEDDALSSFAGITPVETTDATYNPVDAVKYANQSVNFNKNNVGNFQSIASQINKGSLDDRIAMLDTISPAWQEQRDIASASNTAMMKGEIPIDVQRALQNSAAFKSVSAGTSGGPQRSGVLARDLGLTSLDLVQQGQDNAKSWLSQISDIAMPEQITAGNVMEFSGLSSNQAINTALTNEARSTDTQLANIGNRLKADTFNVEALLSQADQQNKVYENVLSSKFGILSQKLSDQTNQTNMKNQQNSNLWSGIGGSLSSGIGSMAGAGAYG